MLKKILSASLVCLQILTQSASAFEFQPVIQPIAIQPLQISSDILKNKMPFSGVNDFLFFNISDYFVNHPLVKDQGIRISGRESAGEMLSSPAGWRLTNAYLANLPALITLNGFRGNPSSDSMGLTEIKNQFQLNPDYSSGFMPAASLGKNVAAVMRNQVGATIVSQYAYINDNIGRRTSVVNTGTGFTASAFSLFGYNTRSELTGSNRYLGTNIAVLTSPVPAETRAYVYDPIGNRTNMTVGTTAGTYTANNLNQYASQTGPANTFTHDFDGNLAQITGTRNMVLTYDGENRLLSVQPVTPVANNKRLEFVYDYQGRRVQKLVYNRSGSSWVLQTTKRFVYDGWNMIEEQTVSATTKYYVYGLDLSQSLQGAGGVGGLLAKAEGAATHQYFYDANGNISQMINAASGAVDARYEYDAYGNSILATGTQAAGNTMRFSTKYLDTEYTLYYYGYRYYDPATGRWLSRDPMGEMGGYNLYQMVKNNIINKLDFLGLATIIASPNDNLTKTIVDFLNGGESNTWIFKYPHSLAKRFQSHEKLRFIWETFNHNVELFCKGKCGSNEEKGEFWVDATFQNFVFDAVTFLGYYGEGMGNQDYGINAFGSFGVKYWFKIDCKERKKALKLNLYNQWSVSSLSRNPVNKKPLITNNFLNPVDVSIDYDIAKGF